MSYINRFWSRWRKTGKTMLESDQCFCTESIWKTQSNCHRVMIVWLRVIKSFCRISTSKTQSNGHRVTTICVTFWWSTYGLRQLKVTYMMQHQDYNEGKDHFIDNYAWHASVESPVKHQKLKQRALILRPFAWVFGLQPEIQE